MSGKTSSRLWNEACQSNLPLLVRRGEIIALKWVEPPRPQASFGLIGNWVAVGNEVKDAFAELVIPFQPERLGWVKRETLRLFRFDTKKKRMEKLAGAMLHSEYSLVHAAIELPGVYGLIGLHSHPLVQDTIRLICEMKPVVRALPADKQRAFRDRICDLVLCAGDMDRFWKSGEGFADMLRDLGQAVPGDMPALLPRPAVPGETVCDRCHGIDIVDFPDCHVLEPIPVGRRKQAVWENVGPKHISGAMRQIVIDPTDRRRLYAVSANGGIWRLDNVKNYPNSVWRPLTDALSNLRFRTMAVAPSNGRILYAANSVKELRVNPIQVYCEIYRSNDRGLTWQSIQQAGIGVVHRIVVHPANPDVVFAASSTGFWRQSITPGSWTNIFPADCLDVALDPDDTSIIYLGVRNQGVFKSFTSGSDWSSTPILSFNAAAAGNNRQVIRISLGRRNSDCSEQTSTTRTVVVRFGNEICVNQTSGEGGAAAWRRAVPPPIMVNNPNPPPAQVDSVPGFLEGGSIRRSDTNPRNNNEWCNCLALDPFDATHILVGSITLLESKDGGISWSPRSLPHEDEHSVTFDPEIYGLVYVANDGGIFSSIDGGANWPTMRLSHTNPSVDRGLNLAMGLITSELDHAIVRAGRCVATIDHTGFILSENFDNRWQFLFNSPDGSARHGGHENGYVYACPASLDRYYIFNLRGRDDPTGVTGRLAQFDFTRTNGLVDAPAFNFLSNLQAAFPSDGNYKPEDLIYNENLLGPFAVRFSEARNERLLLFGAIRPGGGFTVQSLRLATNGTIVTTETTEATNAGEAFFALTFVPNDPDRAFAITQSGELFERDFTVIGQLAAVAQWNFPASDRFVSGLIAVSTPTIRLYAFSQHGIGRFDDDTQTWTTVHVWPEPNETIMALIVHPSRKNTLCLGTNRGVYFSEDGGINWDPYRQGMPAIPITALCFDQGYLYAATFGRGLWRCKPCPGS